jgi:hypothetical protein
MKLPRDLSGSNLADVLCRKYGYQRVHPAGATSFWKLKVLVIIV